ncbi:MAG: hypothetical protein AAF399_16590 [Bacteroidota bacterium]
MKSTIFSLFLLAMLSAASLQATIFRINNQTGTPGGANGVYSNPQEAHDDAFTGDTLLYEGSSDEYNSTLTVTKQLVITGPGYFQDENPATNVFPAQVRRIDLNRAFGGDATTGAAGTIIQGLDMGANTFNSIDINVSNVIIRKNRLVEVDFFWSSGQTANNPTNTIISQNYFTAPNTSTSHIDVTFNGIIQGAMFRNNIFEGEVEIPEFSFAHFFHNILLSQEFTIENLLGTVRNNVFFSVNPNYNLSADSITHNISMGSGLPVGNSNILNATPGTVFVLNSPVNGSDGQYRLTPSSLALGTGFNGADIGPYGGITAYVQYGYGEQPVIWTLSTDGSVNPGQPLGVSVQAISEN